MLPLSAIPIPKVKAPKIAIKDVVSTPNFEATDNNNIIFIAIVIKEERNFDSVLSMPEFAMPFRIYLLKILMIQNPTTRINNAITILGKYDCSKFNACSILSFISPLSNYNVIICNSNKSKNVSMIEINS